MRVSTLNRIIVFVSVFLLVVFGQATRILAGTTGEIAGTITDASTAAPIAGAHITAVSPSGTYKTISNTRGYYAIVNVFPDTYSLTVSAEGFQTTTSAGNTVNQDQVTPVSIAMNKEVRSLGRVTVRSATSVVQPNTAPDQYVLNAANVDATNGSGGSYGLYQTPGVIGTLPGVTTDASGYSHIRGSRLEEIGYEYDGITTVEPVTGTFSTNLVNDGLARVELSTGGYSAAGGNAISGVVNTVVGVGAYPGRGSVTFLGQSPTFYHGMNFDYGNGTPDGRFTYYLAGVWWNSDYDWADRTRQYASAESLETAYGAGTINRVNPSRDQVLNLHYKLGANDDLQFLTTNGIEHYDNNTLIASAPAFPSMNLVTNTNPVYGYGSPGPAQYLDPATGLCSSMPGGGGAEIALFPGQQLCNQKPDPLHDTDHDDQGYFIDKAQIAHSFSSSSFMTLRYARVASYVTFYFPFGGGAFGDVWENRHSDQQEWSVDFTSQVNSKNLLKIGAMSNYSTNYLALLFASSALGEVIPTNNHDKSFYIADTYRPFDKLTLDLSGRSDTRQYLTITQPSFSDHSNQGRAGFAYAFTPNTVVRGSYGNFVELPYMSRVERIFTLAPDFMNISAANQAFLRDSQPEIPQNHSYDIALEQELGHGLSFKVNPFWRNTTNLVLSLRTPGHPFSLPQAVGPYYVQGVESVIRFDRGGQGWSGFVDYTHTRALSAVTGDYNQTIPLGIYRAKALFPANYVPTNVANLVATYKHDKWTFNPNIEYVGGYPYGVGQFTYDSAGNVVPNGIAYVPGSGNTVLLDPQESKFADGRICCASVVANLNIYYAVTPKVSVGVQMQNLNRNYKATALEQNPYFPAANSADGVTPGFNGFYSYGNAPYVPAAINGSQEFLFTLNAKI